MTSKLKIFIVVISLLQSSNIFAAQEIWLSAYQGNIEEVKEFIRNGADVNPGIIKLVQPRSLWLLEKEI